MSVQASTAPPCMYGASELEAAKANASASAPGPKLERLTWEPVKAVGKGGCCSSQEVNLPPADHSLLGADHDGSVTLKRVLLFVNPHGGKKRGIEICKRAVQTFEAHSVAVTVIQTTHARHVEEHLRETASSDLATFEVVVGIGGDGTMSEMVNGLLARTDGFRIPLGLIAGGTGNSFSGDLLGWQNKGGYNNDKLVNTVQETVTGWCKMGVLHGLDVGKITFGDCTVRYSMNWIGYGLGVEANIIAEKHRWLGPARYDAGAIASIAKNGRRHCRLTLDGQEVVSMDQETSIIGICNTQSATFRFCPGAKVDDGLLDVSVLQHMPRGRLLKIFDLLKRDGAHVFEPEIKTFRCRHIMLESDDKGTVFNVDGENCGTGPLLCEVQPAAVQFLTIGRPTSSPEVQADLTF